MQNRKSPKSTNHNQNLANKYTLKQISSTANNLKTLLFGQNQYLIQACRNSASIIVLYLLKKSIIRLSQQYDDKILICIQQSLIEVFNLVNPDQQLFTLTQNNQCNFNMPLFNCFQSQRMDFLITQIKYKFKFDKASVMSAQETNNKSRILNKLLIPEGSHYLKNNNNSILSHQSSNHNLHISNHIPAQGRPSKSHSLYNVKDFLPTQSTDLNSHQQSQNSVKRTQTQPNIQNSSKIFFLKTVTDNSQQSYLKERAIQNQSLVQQLKKKDFKIDDLEAQVKKLKFDKAQAQNRYQKAESEVQKIQKDYNKLRQQFKALKDCFKQSQEQLLNLKKKQEKKKRQIKFWSRKVHIDIQPRNSKYNHNLVQKYSISSQTDSHAYNNYPTNDSKRSMFSINLLPPGYSNQQSQKTSHQTSQQNFYPNKNRNEEFYLRNRRTSEYQINQLNRADTKRVDSKTDRNLNKLSFLSNLNKENEERRSNFNIPLPIWQTKNIEQKGWNNKIKDEAIQIYPINQRQVQSVIKSLLQ